jgi:hypothetical protein
MVTVIHFVVSLIYNMDLFLISLSESVYIGRSLKLRNFEFCTGETVK